MTLDICDVCKEEVRFGTRGRITGFLHREEKDHNVRFGPPGPSPAEAEAQRLAWVAAHAEYVDTEKKERIPADTPPEVRSVPLDPDGPTEVRRSDGTVTIEELPGGARTVRNAARAAGWTITRATYARGPWPHATQDAATGIVDTVVLTLRRGPQRVTALWKNNSFEWALVWLKPGRESHRVNSKVMKAFIKAAPEDASNTLEV